MSEPPLPSNVTAGLQARIALLEQENAALRQEQAQLRQSEARYRQVVENAPISIAFIAADGRSIAGNRAFEQMSGVTIAQLTEQNFNIFTDPQLIENWTLPYMQRALAGETVIEPPTYYNAGQTVAGGHFLRGQGHYFPICDELGRVQEVVEICPDVTALYEAQQALLQAEQARVAELVKINEELRQRDRLLEVTAIAANTLLTIAPFDQAVDTALQVIGEALDTDRANVIENFAHPSDLSFPCWRVLYEWDSPDTVPQFADSDAAQGSYKEVQWLYELLQQGKATSYLLEEAPEPFRSAQIAIGAKATHLVPIFVEGKWWGVVGLDDCREAKQRSLAELSVLRVAADCIGSAIQRERTQQALLQAEQARSQALKRHNTELQQTLDRLSESEHRYRTLFELSNEGISRFSFEQPVPTSLSLEEQLDLVLQHYRYVEANKTFCAQMGLSINQLREFTLNDFHGDLEANRQVNRSILANGYQIRNAETDELDALGRRKYFLNNVVCDVRDGYLWGGWCMQTDITELREAQEALLQAEQARSQALKRHNTELQQTLDRLSESEERFRILFELSSEGFYYIEVDPPCPIDLPLEEQCDWLYQNIQVVEANPAFAAMYGVDDPGELVGLQNADVHVEGSAKNARFIRDTVENNYRFRNLETEERDRQGRQHYFLNNGVYVIKDGYTIGGWATQIDIAELRQTQQALLQAEQARSAELEKVNNALKRSLDSLAAEPSLDKFLGQVLGAIAEQFDSPLAEYWYHPEDTAYIGMMSWQGQIYDRQEIAALHPTHPGVDGFKVPSEMIHGEILQHRKQYFIIEDWLSDPFVKHVKWMPENGLYKQINVPMVLGDECIGALIVLMSREHQITTQQIELAQALAHQATLAAQLTRLAEAAKQAAISREQEKAAQARATELAKINAALEVEVIARSQAEQLARGQTEALIKILVGLAAEPNLDSFLGNALRAIAEQLGERSAGLWLYDDAHDATILHLNYESGSVHRGAQTNRPAASIHRPLKGWDVEYLAALRQQKVLIHTEHEFASPGYATSRASYLDRGIKTVLYVSLFFGDRFLGFITIRSTRTRHYQSEEVELARVLAYQVALAIQLTQLAKQSQQSAVLEERNRLARDIHDTLAQVLTGVIVQLQAAENPYTTDPHDRQEHLAQAHLLAKQGLSEARRSIRALRSQLLEATDFASALTDLAEQMAIGTGLQVDCQIEATPYWLEPEMESHLFRIAQEAMTNTLKHAQASTLHLKLVYEPTQVQLQVSDNGQGFDPTMTSDGGYGVIGMQERSQQIGAQFQLTSRVGQGTIVCVIVPISAPTLTQNFP